jgi:hypothetical protein
MLNQMLTKDYIRNLKNNGNGAIGHLIKEYQDSSSLIFILENLGQLPKSFDGSFYRIANAQKFNREILGRKNYW